MKEVKIGIISDTHIHFSSEDLPSTVYKELDKCDVVLHAGDFVSRDFYERLKKRYRLVAVAGNMDEFFLRRELPTKEIFVADDTRIGLFHGEGAPTYLIDLCLEKFKKDDVDIIVYGHSHQAHYGYYEKKLFINPGSPTDRIFTSFNSMALLTVGKGKNYDVKIVKI